MLKRFSFAIAVLLGAAVVAVGAAHAETERLPASGAPAFQVDVPSGWASSRDGSGNLYIVADDRSAVLVLNMVAATDAGSTSLDTFAAAALAAAQAKPFTRSEDATLAGVAGKAYYSTLTNQSGVTVQLRMVVVRTDATHFAVETQLTQPNDSAVQLEAFNALISGVALIGR